MPDMEQAEQARGDKLPLVQRSEIFRDQGLQKGSKEHLRLATKQSSLPKIVHTMYPNGPLPDDCYPEGTLNNPGFSRSCRTHLAGPKFIYT